MTCFGINVPTAPPPEIPHHCIYAAPCMLRVTSKATLPLRIGILPICDRLCCTTSMLCKNQLSVWAAQSGSCPFRKEAVSSLHPTLRPHAMDVRMSCNNILNDRGILSGNVEK